jgi:hypothetical protein
MKSKFPDFDIYYGLGFPIINGKVSGTRHAQPIWETNGVTTTIDPTPVNCNEDKVTQKFSEERDHLFNQPQGSVRQQPQGGSSGVIPSSGAQPQGSDRQQTQESKKEAKSKWEEALDKALEESKKTRSRPKVVNAASASLNIDETIRQGILVYGGKRLSEQDKYSLELNALKKTHFTTFEGAPMN